MQQIQLDNITPGDSNSGKPTVSEQKLNVTLFHIKVTNNIVGCFEDLLNCRFDWKVALGDFKF